MNSENLSERSLELILGDRNESYGTPADDFNGIALIWSGILNQKLKDEITGEDVALMMVGLKLRREAHKAKEDNIVDAHGYLHCLQWLRTGLRPARGGEQ